MGRNFNQAVSGKSVQNVLALPWWARYKPARILYLDDIEGVLKWTQTTGTVTRDSSIDAFEGSYALKLVTGNVAGNTAIAEQFFGFVPLTQFMLQCRWHAKNALDTTLRSMDFRIYYYDGVNVNMTIFRYSKNLTAPQNKWQYLDSAGAFADFPGGAQALDTVNLQHNYFRAKLDLRSGTPVLRLLESNELVLKGLSLPGRQAAVAGAPYLNVGFVATTDVALASSVWIDDVILSDLEP